MYGPRQNLLSNVVKTFAFNNCFRHSYSKMCKNVTHSGRIIILTSAFQVSNVLRHLCSNATNYTYTTAVWKLKKMMTFDDATAQRTVINFCVEPIQTFKNIYNRCKARIDIRMYLSCLCTSGMQI